MPVKRDKKIQMLKPSRDFYFIFKKDYLEKEISN